MMNMFEPNTARRAAWRRWEMTRFDEPTPREVGENTNNRASNACDVSDVCDASTRLRIEAELEHRQRQAQEQGYAQGYAEGHAQGLEQGAREGRTEGLRQGTQEGLQAGFQTGLQDGKATAQQHAQHLQRLAHACAQALNALEHEVGHALVNLAASIAERVLHSTLAAHPEKMLDIVRDVVRLHGDSDAVLTLRVHPQDHDLVRQYLECDGALKRWRLLADETQQAGGCQAQTALGAVDATLQTRWRKALGSLGIDARLRPITYAAVHANDARASSPDSAADAASQDTP